MNPRRVAGSALIGATAVYLNRRWLEAGDRLSSAKLRAALQHRNTVLEATAAEQKAELLELRTRLAWQQTHLAEKDELIEQLGKTRADLQARLGEQGEGLATRITELDRALRKSMIDDGACIVFQKRSHDSIDLIAVNLAARKELGFLGRFDNTVGTWALGWLQLVRITERSFLDLEPDEQAWLVEAVCPAELTGDLSWHAANVRLFN